MTKYYGRVGFGQSVQTAPGIWEDTVVEYKYYGDVTRNARRLENESQVVSNLEVGNSISIVADAYANQNFFAIRYVEWMGTLWIVSRVEVKAPRLEFTLGGVYNGPTPSTTDTP